MILLVIAFGVLCGTVAAADVFPMLDCTGMCAHSANTGSFWYVMWSTERSWGFRCCKCPPGTYMASAAHSRNPYSNGDYTSGDSTNDGISPLGYPGGYGQYRGTEWAKVAPCVKCPPGTASSTRGATSDQTCQSCPSGFFAANSGSDMCAPCPPGSWSTPGSSSCFNVSSLPAVDVPSGCSLRDFPSSEVVGDVIDSIDVSSESACRAACCARAPCQGYTFFKPLLSIPRCTLLGSNITYVVPSNQFVSAVRSGVLGY
jgi:hypothetical protein